MCVYIQTESGHWLFGPQTTTASVAREGYVKYDKMIQQQVNRPGETRRYWASGHRRRCRCLRVTIRRGFWSLLITINFRVLVTSPCTAKWRVLHRVSSIGRGKHECRRLSNRV
jgi:hypothetical protein